MFRPKPLICWSTLHLPEKEIQTAPGPVEARMPDIVEELRDWAKRIRRDAEVTPYATSGEDSELLDRAANEIEKLREEIETLQSD
jgi:hypothetical protein